MALIRFYLVITIFWSLVTNGLLYLENDGWIIIELHHFVADSEEFFFRGNITVPSLNTGFANMEQRPLTTLEKNYFKISARRDEFYRLRANITYSNGAKDSFTTSSKACSLVQSNFNDVLWIAIDETGYVTAVTETGGVTDAVACTESEIGNLDLEEFTTDVLIRHTELAPVPDTASFVQKVEREREARERGEMRDNRGFIAKYWMYIVPVVLLVFISGATNQEVQK